MFYYKEYVSQLNSTQSAKLYTVSSQRGFKSFMQRKKTKQNNTADWFKKRKMHIGTSQNQKTQPSHTVKCIARRRMHTVLVEPLEGVDKFDS